METIKELKELVYLFKRRKLHTNDSIIMVGDLEKLEKLLNFGFGLGDGMDEKDSEHEVRYDIEGENYGGHI